MAEKFVYLLDDVRSVLHVHGDFKGTTPFFLTSMPNFLALAAAMKNRPWEL